MQRAPKLLQPALSCVRSSLIERMRVPVYSNAQKIYSNVFFNQRFFASDPHAAEGTYLNKEEVTARVLNTVKEFQKVDPTKVNPTAHFQKDLGLDSLDAVELLMGIEDEFCVEIPDSDADKILSCEDAIKYIASHPQAK